MSKALEESDENQYHELDNKLYKFIPICRQNNNNFLYIPPPMIM